MKTGQTTGGFAVIIPKKKRREKLKRRKRFNGKGKKLLLPLNNGWGRKSFPSDK